MSQPLDITPIMDDTIETAKQITDSMKPEIEARRDTCKTLISVSSAALVFTITFAPNFITPNSPYFIRYSVVACWVAFISCLVCSVISLWLAVTALNLPSLVMMNTKKFEIAALKVHEQGCAEPVVATMAMLLEDIGRTKTRSVRFFKASLVSFGLAVTVFTALGIRQLVLSPTPLNNTPENALHVTH